MAARPARFLVTAAIASVVAGAAANAQSIDPEAAQEIQALLQEKAARTPAQRKIGSHLIYAARQSRGLPVARGVAALRLRVQSDAISRVLVDIAAIADEPVQSTIVQLGGEVVSSFPRYHAIRAWLPVGATEELAALAEVKSIRPAARPVRRKLNTSEGDVAHRANLVRGTVGVDGSGVTIGVLSDSVDHLAAVQASGDVGAVTVLPGQSGTPASGEGTAMLEIIHDLAPGATLLFATAYAGEASMATNIGALRAAGCDIIVDDVGYLNEPVFQDGIIAQAVEAVSAAGALYFSAAGNGGNQDDGTSGTWEGDFVASASTIAPGGGVVETLHSFGPTTFDTITDVAAGSPAPITLQWSDAFGASANDYDLFVIDASTGKVVTASTDDQSGTGDPIEAIDTSGLANGGLGLRLAIGKYAGDARYLHLDTNGGALAIGTAGEIYGHPAAASAIGVAAVSAAGLTSPFVGGAVNPVEPFSSDGPRRVFYRADGTAITPGDFLSTGGDLRLKPDLAAADGVKVAAPGFNPFYGTSAAAPHAAAIAALVKSANPALTAAEIRTALTATALDINAPGFDRDSGSGLLDAFAAVQSVVAAATPTPTSTPIQTATFTPLPTATPTASATPPPSPTLTISASPTHVATETPTTTSTPLPVCVGDCDHGGTVTVDELVIGVGIALDSVPLDACAASDADRNGNVTENELVAAVNNALNGCP